MNKIMLVIGREYTTRVKKKSFIVMTLLGPLLFALIMVVPIWLASRDSAKERAIEVIDESGFFAGKFEDTKNLKFFYANDGVEASKNRVREGEFFGTLYIKPFVMANPQGFTFYSEENVLEVEGYIENSIENHIEDYRISQAGINQDTLKALQVKVALATQKLTDSGEKDTNSIASTATGYTCAMLIYFFIFYYGTQVMRGVIEEKSNRIVEVIVSSLKPFQLMMGKIIGIAAVGLTQFVLWVVLTMAVITGIFYAIGADQLQGQETQEVLANMPADQVARVNMANEVMGAVGSINFLEVGIMFIFFFLGAYLLYSALFAAVGSAVDSDADSQQFLLPITIPLILSIVVLGAIIKEPDGDLAFWMSMIPFTAPIVMMMRVPFGVPLWQEVLSISLVICGFVFTTWVAGRIYRVGILMHGTKVNYKVLAKWFSMKN